MSYQALARKWRPRNFAEVIGQEHVVSALVNALDNQRIHHAFIFTGTRGVGKTTLARIFARALNCETGVSATPCGQCIACSGVDNGNYIDLIEVDAASRTKVDDTRELLDNVQYAPTMGRFKIYLIDEVHMLSTHSFNALLKTLEEPPPHVKFLLATTDPQKLPATILSRCIQFNLKAMDVARLNQQLEKILHSEEVGFDQEALVILSRSADGSVRDALSLLDQAIAFGNGEVRTEQVRKMLGMIDDVFICQLLQQICAMDCSGLLETVAEMAQRSVDYKAALDDILSTIHNIALYQVNPQAVEWKGIDLATIAPLSQIADAEILQLLYQIALIGKRDLELAPDPRTGFEMVLLRMTSFQPTNSGTTLAPHSSASVTPKTSVVKGNQSASTGDLAAAAKNVPAQTTPAVPVPEAELPNIPAPESPSITIPAGFSGEELCGQQGWATFVEQSGFNGISKELVMNMAPRSFSNNTLELVLNQESKHLFNDSRLEKIKQHCVATLGDKFRLKVVVDQIDGENTETPVQQKQRHVEQRQQSAEQAFTHDPNVQELVDLFDAEIVTDSISPPPS